MLHLTCMGHASFYSPGVSQLLLLDYLAGQFNHGFRRCMSLLWLWVTYGCSMARLIWARASGLLRPKPGVSRLFFTKSSFLVKAWCQKSVTEWFCFVSQHIRRESSKNEFTTIEASKAENRDLNRYRDVYPYDHSRVKLESCEETDYINASLVKVSH